MDRFDLMTAAELDVEIAEGRARLEELARQMRADAEALWARLHPAPPGEVN
jgi:hypothetical protein